MAIHSTRNKNFGSFGALQALANSCTYSVSKNNDHNQILEIYSKKRTCQKSFFFFLLFPKSTLTSQISQLQLYIFFTRKQRHKIPNTICLKCIRIQPEVVKIIHNYFMILFFKMKKKKIQVVIQYDLKKSPWGKIHKVGENSDNLFDNFFIWFSRCLSHVSFIFWIPT